MVGHLLERSCQSWSQFSVKISIIFSNKSGCFRLYCAQEQLSEFSELVMGFMNLCVCLQRDGCPKIINLGSAKTDLFYERKKYGFKKR